LILKETASDLVLGDVHIEGEEALCSGECQNRRIEEILTKLLKRLFLL
jgi:hypothetical protein